MLPHSGERAVEESFRFSVVLKCVELRQNCQQFHQLKEIVKRRIETFNLTL